jgi:hypothetical protein
MTTGMITTIRTITDTIMGTAITSKTGMTKAASGRFELLWCHPPRKRGIQYSAAPEVTGSPAFAGDDSGEIGACPWFHSTGTIALIAALLLAAAAPAKGQTAAETLRVENEYRECLFAKSRSGRYAHGERDSDFGLIGECRNKWVAYMDVCIKAGFDNPACVMKSRLVIHAILNLTGK